MTNEQTLEQFLLTWNSNAYIGMCECDDMKNAISALEKQIPMRIRREKYFYGVIPYCPVCNKQLTEWASKLLCDNYCRVCGQALDWSEDPKWFTPFEKMPNIGDRIIVQDWSGKDMEIVFESYPSNIVESNVCKWRYA